MATIFGGAFIGLINYMTFGQNGTLYRNVSDIYIYEHSGVEVLNTMDDYGQGAIVVLKWNGDYLLYHSDAENLQVSYY